MEEFLLIWESSGFVNIPLERWITILLRLDWEIKVSDIRPKVYPLGNKGWKVVDNTFDKIQK